MDLAEARRRCRHVAIATFASALMISALIAVSMIATSGRWTGNALLDLFSSPWMFLDVALMIALGIGMWRRSRFCAVSLFVYFLLNKVAMLIEIGHGPGIIITVLCTWYFWRGIRASFAWHRIRRESDPMWEPTPAWQWGLVCVPASLFAVSFGFASWLHLHEDAPEMHVVPAHLVPPHYEGGLRDAGILSGDEPIWMFYSEALMDYRAAGAILTSRRVISYGTAAAGREVFSTPYERVTAIHIVSRGNIFADTVIAVSHVGEHDHSRDGFLVYLSRERQGDEAFIELLEYKTGLKAVDATAQAPAGLTASNARYGVETPRNIM